MIAALFEVVIGVTGLVGWLMKFIGPLTICPTVTLIGLSLFKSAPDMSSKYWPIAILYVFFTFFQLKNSNICFFFLKFSSVSITATNPFVQGFRVGGDILAIFG